MSAEEQIRSFENLWSATEYKQQLLDLLARIITDRKQSPISNVVCLAIGGVPDNLKNPRDVQQFVVLLQMIVELSAANPSLLDNMVAQDPDMTPEWRAVFAKRGIKVVRDPAAFKLIGPNTLLVAPCMIEDILASEMKDNSGEVAMYFGNGAWLRGIAYRHLRNPHLSLAPGVSRAPLRSMLDETFCKYEDVPCYRPNGKAYSPDSKMQGLTALDIWWRPTSRGSSCNNS